MTIGDVRNDSETRLMVINLRLRLEQIAVQAVTDSFRSQTVNVGQTNISNRMAFVLVAYQARTTSSELLGLIRLARHIYRRTSDVLHGRSSMVNLPTVLLSEWETVVARLETIARIEPKEELDGHIELWSNQTEVPRL